MGTKQMGALPPNPTASAPGDTASPGAVGDDAALNSHKHPREAWGVAGDTAALINGSATAGSSGKVADAAHRHAMPAGSILAEKVYSGSQLNFTTSSSTFANADATNLAVTFIAPPSGNVFIDVEMLGPLGASAAAMNLAVASSTFASGAAQGSTQVGGYISGAPNLRLHVRARIPVSGLTAGTPYTFTLQAASDSNGVSAGTCYFGGNTGSGILTVIAR